MVEGDADVARAAVVELAGEAVLLRRWRGRRGGHASARLAEQQERYEKQQNEAAHGSRQRG
jgi:hypothetical protein